MIRSMTLHWLWMVYAIAIVAAARICIGVILHLRHKREIVRSLDEFTRRIEAMEFRSAAEHDDRDRGSVSVAGRE